MTIQHKFWDRIAGLYARTPVADEAAYQAKLEKSREYFTKDSKIFEFGCGTGSTAINHAPYARNILAIDVSGKMIEIARDKAAAKGIDNVRFEVCTIEDYDGPVENFDVVMAHSILHLVKDRGAVISKARALLKPGGIFISSTICIGDSIIGRTIGMTASVFSLVGLLPYINNVTSEMLVNSIEKAGFNLEHEWRPKKNSALFLIARKA